MVESALIKVMSDAAIKAGKGLVRDFGEVDQLQISRKGTANFVTQSDIRAEKVLQRELLKARPDFGFLLEEGGEIEGKDTTLRWIIDPLDGTSNFIHAIPYFCISIALEKRHANGKSEIAAGVIYDPVHNELFAAERGKGAQVNGRKLYASRRDKLDEAMFATSNPRRTLEENRTAHGIFSTIAQSGTTVRFLGATALDLANVAAGRLDGCWYHTIQPWDIAAGILLVQEAGGWVSDLAGKPADAHSKALLASNQALAPTLQKFLSPSA